MCESDLDEPWTCEIGIQLILCCNDIIQALQPNFSFKSFLPPDYFLTWLWIAGGCEFGSHVRNKGNEETIHTYHTNSKAEELDDVGNWHRIQAANHSVEYGNYSRNSYGHIMTDSQNNRQASSCRKIKCILITALMSMVKQSPWLVFVFSLPSLLQADTQSLIESWWCVYVWVNIGSSNGVSPVLRRIRRRLHYFWNTNIAA